MRLSAAFACVVLPALCAHTAERTGGLRIAWEKNILTITGPSLPENGVRVLYLEAYCRSGSTDRVWKETTIGHTTQLLSAAPDGKTITLRCTVNDGVIVDHAITAGDDCVTFDLTAHNPTETPSDAQWVQPCIQLKEFTGKTQENYLPSCFIFVAGKLTRMPFEPWAMKARYIPGQVWCPQHVNRNDVNPRPLSSVVPSNGLIGAFSADGKTILATACEPYQVLFQGVIVCLHADFRIGGLKPNESKKIRGKIYVMRADEATLLKRYKTDFPEQAN
jgi:hypothetical protein